MSRKTCRARAIETVEHYFARLGEYGDQPVHQVRGQLRRMVNSPTVVFKPMNITP